jgi:hypothetical protein
MHDFPLPAWYAALKQDRNSLNHFEVKEVRYGSYCPLIRSKGPS